MGKDVEKIIERAAKRIKLTPYEIKLSLMYEAFDTLCVKFLD